MITRQIDREKIDSLAKQHDPGNLLGIAFSLHGQIEKILKSSENWHVPKINPGNILILGMGGSAIGGDLIRAYAADRIKVPIEVNRGYDIPAYADSKTLCIASSYSGNTEETLAGYNHCKAKNCRIAAISTGGQLAELANTNNDLFYQIPGGLQPRAALGYSFASLYSVLVKSEILPDTLENLAATADFLKNIESRWEKWTQLEENPPLHMAVKTKGKIPVIYSSTGYMEPMAYRWKCQYNENSKMIAYTAVFPELNHNEIVGWGAEDELKKKIHVIILRSDREHERVKARIELTRNIMESRGVMVEEVFPEGRTDLNRLFYMILFGDLLTIYSAYLHGKDPAEIDSIHFLKKELAKLK